MVAWDAAVPGTPKSTEASVSLVVVTANIPNKNANAGAGSIKNVNGNRIARPTKLDKPGIAPKYNPIKTPRIRYPIAGHWRTNQRPSNTASRNEPTP